MNLNTLPGEFPRETRRTVLKQLGLATGIGVFGGALAADRLTRPAAALESGTTEFTADDREIESFDGTMIAATLYEPTTDGPHPAILMTHGWGSNRGSLEGLAASYASREYVVLTYDSRGFGESGGQVTSTGPNEQQDASELITWLSQQDSVLTDGEENPRIGMDGFSYGGGIQFRTAAHDDRLDAIVPRVTWNDNSQGLAPNNVLKATWLGGLSQAAQDDNVDPAIETRTNEILERGRMTEDDRNFYQGRSPVGYPDEIDAPALIIQEWTDRLFPVNQAVDNFEWVQENNTEAALVVGNGDTHFFGETPPGTETSDLFAADAALTWLDAHLKGDGDHGLATINYYDQSADEFSNAETFPPESAPQQAVSRSLTEDVLLEAGDDPVGFDFGVRERTEIVGIPSVTVTANPTGEGFSHLMVALQHVADGEVTTIKEQVTPQAIEAEGEIEFDLFGVQRVLEAGDRLRLAVAAWDEPLSDVSLGGDGIFVDTSDEAGVELLSGSEIELSIPATAPLADTPIDEVPTPDVEPLTGGEVTGAPQTSAVHDISQYGYSEAEFAISGEARVLADPPLFYEDEPPVDPAEYTTRLLVYRPDDPADFNGDVVVEWANVTQQRDAPVTWVNAHEYLMREGYAVVIVSAQKDGVDDSDTGQDLVSWDFERYGDLTIPDDAYSFDIFSQAIQALRGTPETDPLEGLDPAYVYATGMSQSGYYLQPYITGVQPHHELVDGFLPAAADVIDEITEPSAPVLLLNTEDEAPGLFPGTDTPVPNTESFKLWEVAGASHVNFWLTAWFDVMEARDFGLEPDWFEAAEPDWNPTFAGQYGQLEEAVYGICGTNYFPVRYAYQSALERLREWVQTGEEPPEPPRIEHEDGAVQMDDFENAVGGLRLPPIDVPVATYFARDEVCGGDDPLSDLLGATVRFDESQLQQLYPTVTAYLADIEQTADEAVNDGYLLEADRDELLLRAETIDGLPRRSLDDYIDEETGDINLDGVQTAIDDWRGGGINLDLLRDVIRAWRTGV